MKIESSNVNMSSYHAYLTKDSRKESLRAWTGDERPDFEGKTSSVIRLPLKDDAVTISEKAKASQKAEKADSDDEGPYSPDDLNVKKLIVEKMIETLTGRKVRIKVARVPNGDAGSSDISIKETRNAEKTPEKAGWGIEYDSHESHYEHEEMTFRADGVVRTKDGMEIKFEAGLSMSREFMAENDIHLRAGDAKKVDPLVINLDGSAPELTESKFAFDLDSDGRNDQVSFVSPGSGFLALDKDNDGVINDGSELFGPQSGNGFAELAGYDGDGNQWIDENDSIFNKLRIWTKDAGGRDSLATLQDNNIGAIYLGNISARFDMKDSGNQSRGEVVSGGIYLSEKGTAGTIQQIDLAA